jgi:drug/metabolite transporter (DMT)-like permease
MSATLSPRLGIAVLLCVATVFGANHVSARLAFDHGASVAAAVAVRSGCTALALLALLRIQGVALGLPRATLARALLVGALVAVQSFCLYSAVALIPVGLALLVFQVCPMLYVMLCWLTGEDKPRLGSLGAMALALLGLALALNAFGGGGATGPGQLAAGAAWSLGAAASFTLVLYFNAHWLKAVDGRVRTFVMMSVTAALVLAAGAAARQLALPTDAQGWTGLVLLTLFYGAAITVLFVVLPRLGAATHTAALNFEPIAALALAWAFLGQGVAPLQLLGALIVVGSILWLGAAKR